MMMMIDVLLSSKGWDMLVGGRGGFLHDVRMLA